MHIQMLLYLLFSDTLEQLWKDRFEGTAEWRRPFNEIENWMSLSEDTQEKSYTIWQDEKTLSGYLKIWVYQ